MKKNTVHIAEVQDSIAETLEKSLRNFTLPSGKKTIFIKANICAPRYMPGVVTTPQLLFALVSQLRDHADQVIVGESDGYNYPCRLALKQTGIEATVQKAGGTVVNLSEDRQVELKLENSPVKKLLLPKTLLDADAFIDVPVMKTHEYKLYTGALKNLFGCIPDERRIYLHPHLCEVLYQLYRILSPDLTVMDAITAMEGNGPTAGNPVQMNLILTGNDALAVDTVATQLMMLNWKNIDYLAHTAEKSGFREENVAVIGTPIAAHARKFELPRRDLPVEAQLQIYKSTLMTKIFFRSLKFVKVLQQLTIAYRKTANKKPVQPSASS